MITTNFNAHKGIIETNFEGDVTIKEIVDYIITTKENESYPRFLKILTDATEANMDFTLDDLSIIVEENSKSLEKYDTIIDAIIIEKPKETALTFMYQRLAKNNKYRFKIFYTKAGAIKWLENN